MEMKISDMMDHIQDGCVPIQIKEIASCENIREATMEKLYEKAKTKKRPLKASRLLLIAALIVMALSVTVSAATTIRTGRFTLIGSMNDGEIKAMIHDASTAGTWAVEDTDGMRYYFDSDGNETMALPREEADAYERDKQARLEQAVKESITLVDLSTMPLIPHEATELSSDADGRVADFAISNGALVLLHPEGQNAYELGAGDTVTLTLDDANEECYLEFGCFKDGAYLTAETVRAQEFGYTFNIQADGQYCFYVENYSVSMHAFQNCAIVTK